MLLELQIAVEEYNKTSKEIRDHNNQIRDKVKELHDSVTKMRHDKRKEYEKKEYMIEYRKIVDNMRPVPELIPVPKIGKEFAPFLFCCNSGHFVPPEIYDLFDFLSAQLAQVRVP